MSTATLFLTAFGLSMDAFAVSVCSGITIQKLQLKHALKIGLYFGFFQTLMPLIGWLAGVRFSSYIARYDHWIAFVVLGFIGAKMVYEALKAEECISEKKPPENPPPNKMMRIP